jgi:hypothetical protein
MNIPRAPKIAASSGADCRPDGAFTVLTLSDPSKEQVIFTMTGDLIHLAEHRATKRRARPNRTAIHATLKAAAKPN